ncbi:GRF1-interacting factor 1-like [Olea europaea var. sylvestris]|uniref:GRF1-interacting factor 1 n=1 Tax=Olea europaea subsp. europaea TaxID=158383 RepID=A0A8S0QVX1_OLEEU|nr:GRF1-interacting factor 1-like [Olea europaea var. sylvestris]CAA2969998.1 GRF1-interacting factor 1 [Olea europaea subsp. europaea]
MQSHLMPMQPMMAAYYPSNVTTDHIQQYLDENKSLILKIVESQNSGKMSECAENQARLQRNLMYLAAIADSQPQPPSMHSQYPGGILQPGPHYMQHSHAQQMTPQSLMAARSSTLYSQQQYSAFQQEALHSQLGMNTGGTSGLMLQGESHGAGGSGGLGGVGFPDFGRSTTGEGLHAAGRAMAGGGKQEMGSSGPAEGRGGSSGDGGESLYLKDADD